jgi:hypothetical protein
MTPEGGLRRRLDIAMTPVGATTPVRRYDVELSKQLHLIAVDGALRTFVHEHADRPDASGHFHVSATFPHPGLWHVYADAVPQGLGQQVIRFDLSVGTGEPDQTKPDLAPTGPTASDGRYSVRLDDMDLKAGQEAELGLHLLRDGKPAADLTPYLGVAAHAVFINSADLTYVHVHAGLAQADQGGGHMHHEMTRMHDDDGMAGMDGMGPPLAAGSRVPPDLSLPVTAPKPGDYVLWIQFEGGGRVRTVRFVAPVT